MLRLVILLIALAPCYTQAANDYGHVTVDAVVSVYDADTFRVRINQWPTIAGEGMPVRIRGIDAPEIRGKCTTEKAAAQRARHYAARRLMAAKTVALGNMARGKYFRIVADVYVDGYNLAELLVRNGFARRYDGGARRGWCGQARSK